MFRALGVLVVVSLLGCTSNAPSTASMPGAPEQVASVSSALGEPQNGYPNDQERMLHVLINQSRHSLQTPENNACGNFGLADGGGTLRVVPLVYSFEANRAARFTSQHMSELGCYQHDSCCQLGDAGLGAVGCIGPAECTGASCAKTCDAGTGQGISERYALFGFTTGSQELIGKDVVSAYDLWCSLMQNPGNRDALIADASTQLSPGNFVSKPPGCASSYWTLAFGNAQVQVPQIPSASAIYNAPNPSNTSQVYFAATWYDPNKPPQRAEVVIAGHCFDLERAWGADDWGTYETRFNDPDVLPEGCHPYYFLFQSGDGGRVTYPTVGSLQLPLGKSVTCPLPYDPTSQLAADCETGVQQCPAGAQRSCYTGDPETLKFGECRQGYQVCRSGFWSACKDQISVFPEACDGLDNDCDGQVDENNPGGSASCEVFGERGICTEGTKVCLSGRVSCVGTKSPQPEICDNKDNDCDGVVDDGFSILTCGKGECFRVVTACNGGVDGVCTPGTPEPEIADGLDNNCDGQVDEGFSCALPDGGGVPRIRNVSAPTARFVDGGIYPVAQPCKGGLQQCQLDAGWGPALGMILPSKEICDDVDNDCNGKDDIQSINEIGWDRCGTGGCTVFTALCKAGGVAVTCTPKSAQPEICNGVDDNCNNTVDENCECRVDDTRPCYTAPSVTRGVGECKPGTRTCPSGKFTKCMGDIKPAPELCDGLDNDCNGRKDDNCSGVPDGGLLPDGGMIDGGSGGGDGGTAGGAGGSGGGAAGGAGGGTTGGKGCGCTSALDGGFVLAVFALLKRRRVAK